MVSFKSFLKLFSSGNTNSKYEKRNTKVYSRAPLEKILPSFYCWIYMAYQLEWLHFINGHCKTQLIAFPLSFHKVLPSFINVSSKEAVSSKLVFNHKAVLLRGKN